ncbi:hypothetical protein ACPCUF_35065 [Streptomyces griseoincarnatus]
MPPTSTDRVTSNHTADRADLLREAITEGWDVTASLQAEAVQLTDEAARYNAWDTSPLPGESFTDLVAALLAPGDGRAFSDRITGHAHGDETLVGYVLAADPGNLRVTLTVWPGEDPEDGIQWTVNAQEGDTLVGLAVLLVTAAVRDMREEAAHQEDQAPALPAARPARDADAYPDGSLPLPS